MKLPVWPLLRKHKEVMLQHHGSEGKLMVVGKGAAGKTNTVRSLLGHPFNPEWESTIGIDLTEVATSSGTRWQRTEHKDYASTFVHRLAVETMEQDFKPKSTVRKANPPSLLTQLQHIFRTDTQSTREETGQ